MLNKKIILLTILNVCTNTLSMLNIPQPSNKQSLTDFFKIPQTIITIKELKDQITPHILGDKQWWYLDKEFPHAHEVRALCFNHDGTLFATGSVDEALVFITKTQKKIASFAHTDPIWKISFDSKGNLTTASYDSMYHTFDIETQQRISSFHYNKEIKSTCSSENYLAEGKWKSALIVPMFGDHSSLLQHNDYVNSIDIDCTEKYVATAEKKKAHLFDIQKQKKVHSFPHTDTVYSVCFAPCGIILSTGSGNKAYMYNIITKKACAAFTHARNVYATCFDFSGKFFATASQDCSARIFKKYDTWTLEQTLLHKVLFTWLLIEKPNKKINSIELLLANVAEKCELHEAEFDTVWKTFPEAMQSALWSTMREKIKRYGKEVQIKMKDDNCIIS